MSRDRLYYVSLYLIFILHVVGVLGFTVPELRPWFQIMSPFHLCGMAFLLGLWHRGWGWASILFTLVTFIVGMSVEWTGVHYSIPFGSYHYGDALGPKLDGVPYVIGVNWVMLVYASGIIAQMISRGAWWKVPLASLLMVIVDIPLEVIASPMDFWHWEGGSAPFINYLGWFGTALLLHLLFFALPIKRKNEIALPLVVALFLFFSALLVIL